MTQLSNLAHFDASDNDGLIDDTGIITVCGTEKVYLLVML
jgi:hypothetical protein